MIKNPRIIRFGRCTRLVTAVIRLFEKTVNKSLRPTSYSRIASMSTSTKDPVPAQDEPEYSGQGAPLWQQPFWLFKRNWRAAISVSLVNIPLSISLAIASGGTPMQGCATAIFSGVIAGALCGSSYNIYGPAGALTSILNVYAVRYGSTVLPWFALWTGVFTYVMFALKLERFTLYLPNAVMEASLWLLHS